MIDFKKPMKGEDFQKVKEPLKFPVIASVKLDGIRCVIKDGKLLSSRLKEFVNPSLNKKFEHLKKLSLEGWIFDGELYSHELEFNVISGNIRSKSQEIHDSIQFHCFDILRDDLSPPELPYQVRLTILNTFNNEINPQYFEVVKTMTIYNKEELDFLFADVLKDGYEGLIFRQPNSKYKFGRATPKSQDLLKYKPFVTFDGKIVGITQQQISTAESEKNELGKSMKSHKKEFMVDIERASGFKVIMENGIECTVPIGQTEAFRDEVWKNPNDYIGRWIEFKGMEVGAKDKPRHPNFVRWRDDKK